MNNIMKFLVFLFIIYFNNAYNLTSLKIINLSKEDYLFVNKNKIYSFNQNSLYSFQNEKNKLTIQDEKNKEIYFRYLNDPNNGPNPSGNSGEQNPTIDNQNQENQNNEQNENKMNDEQNGSKGGGHTKEGYDFDFDGKETNIPRDKIRDNRNEIMNNTKPGETYNLKGDGYELKVAPMGQKEEGKTSIDFLSCENKLREYYGLDESAILTVFQTETEKTSEKSLTNKVQYVVYDQNNVQLNLSVCSDEQIRINYALRENSTLNTTMYSKFHDKGIDILNSSDSFFNDICYSYSDGGSDMILSDRISEIYQNYSLCDSGCDYEGIDTENLTVSCSCSVVTNDTDDDEEDNDANVKEIVLSLFEDSTFGVIKCYKLVFSITNKYKNIGFWVFLVIVIGHIPLYVLFFKNGINPIKKYIRNEMEKYHYLINENLNNPPQKNEKNSENERNNNNFNFAKDIIETMNREENEDTDKKINFVLPDIVPSNQNIKQQIKISLDNIKSNDLIETENNTKNEETKDKVNLYNNKKQNNELKKNKNAYFLIQVDANNSDNNNIPSESNYILDNYEYDTAVQYDNRTFWRILYIVMISKDNILNTFILKSPLESQPLRICLLLFAYTSDLALNTLFYFSDNISDKYHYSGNNLFWYTLFNNILISVISTLLSLILGSVLQVMTDSKSSIEDEFKEEEKKMREDNKYSVSEERKKEIFENIKKSLKCLKIKMIIFVILDFLILLFFFYFVSSFCEVYQSTQTSWISDAVVSIIISFPIELAIALAITIVYKLSLKHKWELLYKIAKLLA